MKPEEEARKKSTLDEAIKNLSEVLDKDPENDEVLRQLTNLQLL